MKIIGFVLILCAGALFCLQRIRTEKRRLDTLQSFCTMLEQFAALLESEALPMPELVEKLSGRTEGAGSDFLDRLGERLDRLGETEFQELWREALELAPDPGKEACRELRGLGMVLGRYLLDEQKDALRGCIMRLQTLTESTREEFPRILRTSIGCSLTAALLGIILI